MIMTNFLQVKNKKKKNNNREQLKELFWGDIQLNYFKIHISTKTLLEVNAEATLEMEDAIFR